MEKIDQKTNGFLDCIAFLKMEHGGRGGHQRIIFGKVYAYSLKEWKDGYDELCEKKGDYITYREYLEWINAKFLMADISADEARTTYLSHQEEKRKLQEEESRRSAIVKKYRAEFENACDCLYYGYGFTTWKETNKESSMTDDESKIVWRAAFNKMAEAD